MIDKIDWKKCNGLVPVVIQDVNSFDVLMLGFMNQDALKLTQETGRVHFFSRTKGRIWMKGETSGNILNVVEIKIDCDQDSILVLVNPTGNTCHKGTKSCFDYKINFLYELEQIIKNRTENPTNTSYISNLTKKGINKVAQKVGEEASEVIIAALKESDSEFLNESADLLFHLMVLINSRNLTTKNVIDVMKERNTQK